MPCDAHVTDADEGADYCDACALGRECFALRVDLVRTKRECQTLREALTRIANSDCDSFAGDHSKWPTTIAALALGWVSDEPGGKLHPPVSPGRDGRSR